MSAVKVVSSRPGYDVHLSPARTHVRDNSVRTQSCPIINNTPLNQLIQYAYMIKGYQISGGPDWTKSDLFDIVAKPERPVKQGRKSPRSCPSFDSIAEAP